METINSCLFVGQNDMLVNVMPDGTNSYRFESRKWEDIGSEGLNWTHSSQETDW
jgi:hypothetical protein